MRQRIDKAITELGEQIGLDTVNISAHNLRVLRWINDTREQIQELPYDFNALQFTTQLRTNTVVSAGSITLSANGREVTGSSSSWTTNIAAPYSNWYLYVTGDTRLHRLNYVTDATHLTLDVPYEGSSTGGSTGYKIFRKYYPIPYAVNKLYVAQEFTDAQALNYIEPKESLYYYNNNVGNVYGTMLGAYTIWGSQDIPVETTYASVTVTAGSNIVSATYSWLDDDIYPGDEFTLSSTAFNVLKVRNDTSIELAQIVATTLNGIGATARAKDRYFMELIPNLDSNETISLMGYKKVFPLVSTADFIEEGWYPAVRAGVIMRGYEYLKRPIAEKQDLYNNTIKQLIRDQTYGRGKFPRLKQNIRNRYSGYL